MLRQQQLLAAFSLGLVLTPCSPTHAPTTRPSIQVAATATARTGGPVARATLSASGPTAVPITVLPTPTRPAATGRAAPQGLNCPEGYPIKGSQQSMLYQVPGGALYTATQPEICFATAADARAAGFRASPR